MLSFVSYLFAFLDPFWFFSLFFPSFLLLIHASRHSISINPPSSCCLSSSLSFCYFFRFPLTSLLFVFSPSLLSLYVSCYNGPQCTTPSFSISISMSSRNSIFSRDQSLSNPHTYVLFLSLFLYHSLSKFPSHSIVFLSGPKIPSSSSIRSISISY